jgi:hypothetical protein
VAGAAPGAAEGAEAEAARLADAVTAAFARFDRLIAALPEDGGEPEAAHIARLQAMAEEHAQARARWQPPRAWRIRRRPPPALVFTPPRPR